MDYCIYCGKSLESNPSTCPQCHREIKEFKSINTISFNPISPSIAEALESQKTGLLTKGDKKKMIAAIQAGHAGIAPIVIEKIFSKAESRSTDLEDEAYISVCYANISDTNGSPIKEAPRVPSKYEDCDDIFSPAYLLYYTPKKEPYYFVIDQEGKDNLPACFKNILDMPDLTLESWDYPTREGSLADRGAKLLGKLFKRK